MPDDEIRLRLDRLEARITAFEAKQEPIERKLDRKFDEIMSEIGLQQSQWLSHLEERMDRLEAGVPNPGPSS